MASSQTNAAPGNANLPIGAGRKNGQQILANQEIGVPGESANLPIGESCTPPGHRSLLTGEDGKYSEIPNSSKTMTAEGNYPEFRDRSTGIQP